MSVGYDITENKIRDVHIRIEEAKTIIQERKTLIINNSLIINTLLTEIGLEGDELIHIDVLCKNKQVHIYVYTYIHIMISLIIN